VPGSAAEKAGLLVDDIIIRINDNKIDSSRELMNAIGLKGSGESVEIEFVRDGHTQNVVATLDQQTNSQTVGANIHPGLAGAVFASATEASSGGVEVIEIEEGSLAAQRGLRSGDVIMQVNRQTVRNLAQLREIAVESQILFLLVHRGDRALMLKIR
jgi:S1-C subfamily serine protease